MASSTNDPILGRLIDGRYLVRSRIARGGMATVYLATDQRLERRVALKVMHDHLADDNAFKTRFVQEARSAARLAHPNVVNVFDQGQDDEIAYLVMEYLPGITLRELLKEYTRLTPDQAYDIAQAVLGGLAAAHRAGIVHRDLKPENVLLADDGRIKIGDFGLARAVSANTASGQALLGTIAYLSPELVTRGIADARSDIYAMGIMMYEMVVGAQPFTGEQPMQIAYQHANDQVPTPSSANPVVPEEYDELVLWATMRDPDDRPRDAGELLARLVEIRAGGSLGAGRTTVMPSLPDGATRILPVGGLDGNDDGADATATGETASASPVPSEAPSVVRLRRSARRRKILGGWAFALVVLLGAAAAGTGWYFGTGPGALVSVPAVTGTSITAARSSLVDADLRARVTRCASRTVDEGLIVTSTPKAGTRVHQDDVVRVCASSGPSSVAVPDLSHVSRKKATTLLSDAGFVVDAASEQQVFRDDLPKGRVVRALDASGDQLGATYLDGRSVSLVVSLGPVPEVRGDSVDGATSILTDAGLSVSGPPYARRHSGSIPAGDVLKVVITGDTTEIPRGTSVSIVVSSGPRLVEVPNVVGQNFQDGVQALKDAGFTVSAYTILGDDFWATPGFVVASTDPAAETKAPKGSTITVTPNAYAGDPDSATATPAPAG